MPPFPDPPITGGDPGATAHKAWLEALTVAFNLLSEFVLRGRGSHEFFGIYAVGDASIGINSYKTTETSPSPTMKVTVNKGFGMHVFGLFALAADWTSPTFVAPSVNPRIDRIDVDASDGSVIITTGAEAASPAVPSGPAVDSVLIAHIHHTVAETSIKDADDATNGYVELKRDMLNYGGEE